MPFNSVVIHNRGQIDVIHCGLNKYKALVHQKA